MKVSRYIKKLTDRYRYSDSKRMFMCFVILRVLVVLTAVRCLLTHNYESFALCILTLILFLAPAFIEDRFNISIPPLFQAIIFCFIFAAEILGEVDHYYVRIPGWDTMLHTMDWILTDLSFEQGKQQCEPVSLLPDTRRVLFFHDNRRSMGIL